MSALFTFTLLVKITLLLLGALGLDQLLRRKSALACAAMWNAVLLAVAAIPLLCLTMPAIKIPIAFDTGAEPVRPNWQPSGADTDTLSAANLQLPSAIAEERGATPGGPVTSEPARTWFAVPSIWQLLGGIYLAGASVFALRLLLSLMAVGRLKRRATDIQDVPWQRTLQECLSQIGSRAKVRLTQSSEISVPIACGWLEPTIVIPADLVGGLSAAARKGVLVHELVHLLRRDYPWQLLLRCLQVVLWFHPLLWWAERRIHFIRERVCDDFSIFILGDSEMYCDTLLDIAARCQSRLSLSLGLAIVRKGRLAQRLSAMEQSEGNRQYELSGKPKWALGSATLLLVLFLSSFALQPLAVAKDPDKKGEPTPQNKGGAAAKAVQERPKEEVKAGEQTKLKEEKVTITGVVSDEYGKPVKEATVYLFAVTHDPAAPTETRVSIRQLKKVAVNAEGQYELRDVAIPIIPVPKAERERSIESTTLEIVALTKDQKFAWRGPATVYSADETRKFGNRIVIETGIANQLDLALRPTKAIAGRVIDEKGKPVAGAVIRLMDCRRYTQDPLVKIPDSDSLNYCLMGEVQAAPDAIARRKSDSEGRFEFSEIPVDMRGVFFVTHPDYSTVGLGATNAEHSIPDNGVKDDFELQRGEVTVKLRRTYSVPVEVRFEEGDKPAKAMFVRAVEAMAENLKSPAFHGGITDERGIAKLKLPAGKFKIEAGATQYGGTVEVTVDGKSSDKPVLLRVPGAPAEKSPPGAKPNEEPAKEGLKEEKKDDGTKQPTKPATIGAEPSEKNLRHASSENLKKIGIGMHVHHDAFKLFPAQSIKKLDKPLLSWRVKILPYFGEQVLYDQFHLDEPWDSEHNKTLIPKMPAVFASPMKQWTWWQKA